MYMCLNVFAELLAIRPGELLHAVRKDGMLEGMTLPARRHVRGAAIMFNHQEAVDFSSRWHDRQPASASEPTGQPPVTLEDVAKAAGIAPLALWHAVKMGKKLCGVAPPQAKNCCGQLLFEAAAVAEFARHYRRAFKKSG